MRIAFDEQVARLIHAGVPEAGGRSADDLRVLLEPLRGAVDAAESAGDDRLAAAVVLTSAVLSPEAALPLVVDKGKSGRVDMNPTDSTVFSVVDGVAVPEAAAYVLLDVDLGAQYGDVTPQDALRQITAAGRTPLTIDEGVSVLLQIPDALRTRTAYSLLASRAGDQRVPALWVSYGAPRLGWCWNRNPHSWLGSAHAAARAAAALTGRE